MMVCYTRPDHVGPDYEVTRKHVPDCKALIPEALASAIGMCVLWLQH
jgi:hypothetical protein